LAAGQDAANRPREPAARRVAAVLALALATTEAGTAVPPDAGVLSTRVDTLVEAAQWLLDEPEQARRLGARARQAARAGYGLGRFPRRPGPAAGRDGRFRLKRAPSSGWSRVRPLLRAGAMFEDRVTVPAHRYPLVLTHHLFGTAP
jgi:hypothetical protein